MPELVDAARDTSSAAEWDPLRAAGDLDATAPPISTQFQIACTQHPPKLVGPLLPLNRPEQVTDEWNIQSFQHPTSLWWYPHQRMTQAVDPLPSQGPGMDDSPVGYRWRQRLRRLRAWRGDLQAGEARALFPGALETSEWLGKWVEFRSRAEGVDLATVFAPLANGGVHVEWTSRGRTWTHLEIEIGESPSDAIAMLYSTETADGDLLSAVEVADAKMAEVLAILEKVLTKEKARFKQRARV